MALHLLPVALDLENSRGLVLKFRGKDLPLEFYACTCVKCQDEIKKPLTGKLSNKMKKRKKEMRSPNTQGKENLIGEKEKEFPRQ